LLVWMLVEVRLMSDISVASREGLVKILLVLSDEVVVDR
jgi:hypothetical protein